MEFTYDNIGDTEIITIVVDGDNKAMLEISYFNVECYAQIQSMVSYEKGKGYMKSLIIHAVNFLREKYQDGCGQLSIVSGTGRSECANGFYSHISNEKITEDDLLCYTFDENGDFVRLTEMEEYV